ncbi:hypothetical protein FOMPIDRAFT_83158 [Fomitopsis schrenkii]|uniref:Enoyl reductase (ER) domain-containing protein n=1 Tax=Fomitopsis schrenkii TaxID=2126942 RepID=S8G5J6_FOMSC|nr:hypothetical protein FOMPIDRAFT_83158 [Fomitopsis schrenkii]
MSSPPETQKALLLPAEAADYVIRSVPVPRPSPGQVLVKIHAAALNPLDWKMQKTGLFITRYPIILGMDIAGTVEELGEGVENLSLGDRVISEGYPSFPNGAFQQYALTYADVTAKIPDTLGFDEASTIPVGLDTGALGLFTPYIHPGRNFGTVGLTAPWEEGGRGKYAGKPIVVLGGASSVGQYTIQLAKLSGFSPIITTASLHNTDLLRSLGATHVVDRKLASERLREEISKITKEPLDVIFDAISLPETQLLAYELLAQGGTLALVLNPAIPVEKIVSGKRVVKMWGVTMFPEENRVASAQFYKKLTAWLEEGIIKPNRTEVLSGGLAGVADGLERLRNDQVSGVKLVVRPQETA